MRTANVEPGIFRIIIIAIYRLSGATRSRRIIGNLNRLGRCRFTLKGKRLERHARFRELRGINSVATARLRTGLGHPREAKNDHETENSKHASGQKLFSGQNWLAGDSPHRRIHCYKGTRSFNERNHLYENSL